MSLIAAHSETFLKNYLNNASPTGFRRRANNFGSNTSSRTLTIGASIIMELPTASSTLENSYKVVIEGHADEISWFVNFITEEGFINVIRNGGSDHQIAPSKRVNIHTPKGGGEGRVRLAGHPYPHQRGQNGAQAQQYLH